MRKLARAVQEGQQRKNELKNTKKVNGKNGVATNDDDSSIEPDSQESLIESILECDECIANLDSIHVQQRKLLGRLYPS